MKKLIAILISIIFLCMPFSCFASGTSEQYIYSDGDFNICYYLDDEGRPYCYENGEIVYVILPLESNKVSEEENETLNSLIKEVVETNTITRAAPTSWYDMSAYANATQLKSVTYETFVNFELMSKLVTPPLKVNSKLVNLNVVSADMEKSLFSGKKITLKIEFYDYISDYWYAYTYEDNFTGEGVNYTFSPSVTPYLRFTVTKCSSGVKNFYLQVLTWGTA